MTHLHIRNTASNQTTARPVLTGDTLRGQLENLMGLAEFGLETFYEANKLGEQEKEQNKNEIRQAVEWLKANMDFIIADAEFDGRV